MAHGACASKSGFRGPVLGKPRLSAEPPPRNGQRSLSLRPRIFRDAGREAPPEAFPGSFVR